MTLPLVPPPANKYFFVPSVGNIPLTLMQSGTFLERPPADAARGFYWATDASPETFPSTGVLYFCLPPTPTTPAMWVPVGGAGSGGGGPGPPGGGVPELLVLCDTSLGDVTYTLPDPASLPDPKSCVNVRNVNGGVYALTILPGVAGTIDGGTKGIITITNNQGYRFRTAASADTILPPATSESGWITIETVWGGDVVLPLGTPGSSLCTDALPLWISGGSPYASFTYAGPNYWSKPIGGYTFIGVVGWGAGGGGCSGAGDGGGGGPGGGGGARLVSIFDYASFPSIVSLVVGAGGQGGARRISFIGGPTYNVGADGGPTSIITGSLFSVYGGGGGQATAANSTYNGGGGGGWLNAGNARGYSLGGSPTTSTTTGAHGFNGGGANGIDNHASPGQIGDYACADCGGAGGGGGGGFISPPWAGGSSLYGGCGGGGGGSAWPDGVLYVGPGSDGGLPGNSTNGGGAKGGSALRFNQGFPGAPGVPATGLMGGGGGGGGGASDGSTTTNKGADGGNAAGRGGGGGGGGSAYQNGNEQWGGAGGNGGDGALLFFLV